MPSQNQSGWPSRLRTVPKPAAQATPASAAAASETATATENATSRRPWSRWCRETYPTRTRFRRRTRFAYPSRPGRSLGCVIVAHLDLDAFFAAVEELEDPSLRARPLIVGGDPRGRGVVATANYVAREFGIQSAMSCSEALRRCPHAIFLRPRHSLYRDYSRSVWDSVRAIVPTVERTGLDEGYLDLGEVVPDFLRARELAEAVQTAVRGTTRLTCSLGVASSKVVAKVASDSRKPGGITVVLPGKEGAFLGPLP